MYCVIEMYGKDEPWWFFDDWEANIVSVQHFDNYYTALKYYKRQWLKLVAAFPFYKSRSDLMSIFWDAEDFAGVKNVVILSSNTILSLYWKMMVSFLKRNGDRAIINKIVKRNIVLAL